MTKSDSLINAEILSNWLPVRESRVNNIRMEEKFKLK